MSANDTIERLSKAVRGAVRSSQFCVSGTLPAVDPELEIDGLGRIELPLKRGAAKKLFASCQVAPFGKGTRTLVDPKVRKTSELDPSAFRLGEAWNAAIAEIVRSIAPQLGLPADQLEARPYKLLAYEAGGFFLPHRDSEKHDRMVASLIVVLPNPFEGGTLVVRHGATEQRLRFEDAARGQAAGFAAFYADCEHEVGRVNSGVRLALAYNLVLKSTRAKPAPAKPIEPSDTLAKSIASWVARQPGEPLVFALDHHYTERGLSLDLLKGTDRQLASLVAAAAAATDCIPHLAQVSRHTSSEAHDGDYYDGYSGYGRRPRGRGEIEIGEIYEDELSGSEWADIHGKKQPIGTIGFALSAIVSTEPLDSWKPTSEEYEGYTGNAGNTLDRWYHRSAIVLWHRDHHFDVLASSGAIDSIPAFGSMVAKLAKTPKKRLEGARGDCLRFARAIIDRWPARHHDEWSRSIREQSPCDEFPDRLLKLHDRDLIARFLAKVAGHDQALDVSSFVLAASREYGWGAFADELKLLLAERPGAYGRPELPARDLECLSAYCCDPAPDAARIELAGLLCDVAVERFCAPRAERSNYHSYDRGPSAAEKSLPNLIRALVATGRGAGLSRAVEFIRSLPAEFRMGECQVPALKSLIPWSKEKAGTVPPPLAEWLAAARRELETATARRPEPPGDWTRPANGKCSCQSCGQLGAFLADPANGVGRISAREDLRRHVIQQIEHCQFDVTTTLERTRSPFTLVLTKTNGSFGRSVQQYEKNLRLLGELPESDSNGGSRRGGATEEPIHRLLS